MKNKLYLITITLSLLITNCSNSQTELSDEKSQIINFLKIWNNLHNEKNIGKLTDLYDKNVNYYGHNKSNNYIIEDKSKLFEKFKQFTQTNNGISELTKNLLENEIKIAFSKKVIVNGKTKYYPSYLILKHTNNYWKITTEGDLITDKIISKNKNTGNTKKILGDFNGDGKKEFAWIETPKRLVHSEYIIKEDELEEGEFGILYDDYIGCDNSVIHFSDKTIWPITINTTSGELTNIGDLNNDGSENISVYSNINAYSTLHILNVKNYYQPNLIDPISVNRNIYDNIQKENMLENLGNGSVKITYSTFTEKGEHELITKIIKL
ncbi:hypothetical protein PW52_08375 [Tamlana sedimentorum]|uniref:DUF4440 domain-containing protein n=1 Tax=Neotamlana sedimentorum TaxID=1435349 RepID=A0A0D7W9E0_9FLAO|nr:hypothetical protein [Tamlana sedimentorum]KJD35745.1 hypothetical protein PW52_08375 [Tamlana sedimentorum]